MFDRFKLLKWWAQSFLIGISTIVCGFRDDAGIVRHIKEFHTSDLPKQSRVLYSLLCLKCLCIFLVSFDGEKPYFIILNISILLFVTL